MTWCLASIVLADALQGYLVWPNVGQGWQAHILPVAVLLLLLLSPMLRSIGPEGIQLDAVIPGPEVQVADSTFDRS